MSQKLRMRANSLARTKRRKSTEKGAPAKRKSAPKMVVKATGAAVAFEKDEQEDFNPAFNSNVCRVCEDPGDLV